MCENNQVQNAVEVLANVVAKADSVADAILGIQDKVLAEVNVVKTAPWWTVFTFAKYTTVQANDEADARDRGRRKLNRIFPGERNLIKSICPGRPFLEGFPTMPATPVPVSDNGLVDNGETEAILARTRETPDDPTMIDAAC